VSPHQAREAVRTGCFRHGHYSYVSFQICFRKKEETPLQNRVQMFVDVADSVQIVSRDSVNLRWQPRLDFLATECLMARPDNMRTKVAKNSVRLSNLILFALVGLSMALFLGLGSTLTATFQPAYTQVRGLVLVLTVFLP
jgi:hypothetical protein